MLPQSARENIKDTWRKHKSKFLKLLTPLVDFPLSSEKNNLVIDPHFAVIQQWSDELYDYRENYIDFPLKHAFQTNISTSEKLFCWLSCI